ncbi:hypothetical protein T05_3030 [Trichinella murrelli]|uniref:Uncharacterized protein n=1 Tax=Trichinella murrelli TaxID=144512 RepID=A0A0V0T3W1_9BILA|nr:hypothetical protein T05_12618 [Trichinella murrelli]KRX33894.1 hypothetical protein T05_3030 [Trichinella murrelli]
MTEELYRASGSHQVELEQDLEGEERQCATDDWERPRAIIEQARVDCGLTSRLAAHNSPHALASKHAERSDSVVGTYQ